MDLVCGGAGRFRAIYYISSFLIIPSLILNISSFSFSFSLSISLNTNVGVCVGVRVGVCY